MDTKHITMTECLALARAFLVSCSPVAHNIKSADSLLTVGLQIINSTYDIDIVVDSSSSDKIHTKNKIRAIIKIVNTTVERPMIGGLPMYPRDARRLMRSYLGQILCDIEITASLYSESGVPIVRTATIPRVYIGDIPIMIRSVGCSTFGMTPEELVAVGESPIDYGGYYLINGHEWGVDVVESVVFNQARGYANTGYANELARLERVSQPGDSYAHSTYTIITLFSTFALSIEIKTLRLSGIAIPFFWLMRILGASTDYDMIKLILYDYEGDIARVIGQTLKTCMNATYKIGQSKIGQNTYTIQTRMDVNAIALELAKAHPVLEKFANSTKEEDRTYAISTIIMYINEDLYPNVSQIENNVVIRDPFGDRDKKLKFLGGQLRRLLLIYHGHITQTDRDSAIGKRYRPSGSAYAQSYRKKMASLVMRIRNSVRNTFSKMSQSYSSFDKNSFLDVQLPPIILNAIKPQNFTSQLIQAITIGAKPGSREGKASRLLSELTGGKAHIGELTILRKVGVPSGSSHQNTDRATAMRLVTPTTTGYICPVFSKDSGSNVGINKNMACTMSITDAGDSMLLRAILLVDEHIIATSRIGEDFPIENTEMYAYVYVNGDPIGLTMSPADIVLRYRQMRRDPLQTTLDRNVSIVFDTQTNEVYFWIDAGRAIRPLLIVNNNYRDMIADTTNNTEFHQNVALTRAHIDGIHSGELTLDDLRNTGVFEYISTDEQINCYVAPTIDDLHANTNNACKQFTHCEVHPALIFGYTVAVIPAANYSNSARNAIFTNQDPKSSGYYALNHQHRWDGDSVFAHTVERPIISTIINGIVSPSGQHIMLAFACYGGNNQEDSVIFNKQSIDNGLFRCTKIKTEVELCSPGQKFCVPDPSTTAKMQIHKRNYATLGANGYAPAGTILKNGDAIIGKVAISKTAAKNNSFVDKTKFWKSSKSTPAVVVDSYIITRTDGERKCCVKIHQDSKPACGDKFTNRHGQKGVIGQIIDSPYMPFTDDGVCPDAILNPHGFPGRMACGQMIEGLLSVVAAATGEELDATAFTNFDANKIRDMLRAKFGDRGRTSQRLRNGITGQKSNAEIYMVPFYFKRLKHIADADMYAVDRPNVDRITRQGLRGGKSAGGGTRVGDMETAALCAAGAMGAFQSLWCDQSDGYTRYMCNNCGSEAVIVNTSQANEMYKCMRCAPTDARIVSLPKNGWAARGFSAELRSCGIGMELHTQPPTSDVYANPE